LVISQQDDQTFNATLEADGKSWAVNAITCPAFGQALTEFATLPSIELGPWRLRTPPSRTQMVPQRNYHAEWWVIELAGSAPDDSTARIIMKGSQGPFAAWASQTASAIKSCG
jgi:hypothetical protein